MSNEITKNGVKYSATGLDLDAGTMTFEQWDEIGEQIAIMHQASPWWIGDWYVSGEAAFGEAAAQARAISETAAAHGRSLTPDTVMEYAGLARRFPPANRFVDLSFSHHSAVRALPDDRATAILKQAEAEGWSVSRLKRELAEPGEPEPPAPAVRTPGAYDVIMADPPWRYRNQGKKLNGTAVGHYADMSEDDIFGFLRANQIEAAENSALFLWVTNPMLEVGLNVMAAWDFTYTSMVTWRKLKNGKTAFGTGFYFRSATEHILFGVRGSMPPETKNERTYFEAEMLEHSRKPYEVYELIERMYPGRRYIELFARHERFAWDRVGFEAPGVQAAPNKERQA